MAARELPEPIPNAVGTRVQRLAVKEMVDVARERLDGLIAPLRVGTHRGETQHIEVGPRGDAGDQRPASAASGRRRPLRARVR
jgi:hypothetical protein